MINLESYLACFGSLEGMRDVKQTGNVITFWKSSLYPNFRTECRIELKRAESKRGAISYTFVMSWDDIDCGPCKLNKSEKFYSEGALRDGIIQASRHIYA